MALAEQADSAARVPAAGLALVNDLDLVVTDAKMPEMNALDIIPRIREEQPGVPIIIVTGYPTLREAFENESYRVEAFFLKPVVIKDLLGKIAELLDGKTPKSIERMH